MNKIDMKTFCGEWKEEENFCLNYKVYFCSNCKKYIIEYDKDAFLPNFCSDCGLAMTEKGKEILRKRLEGMG